MLDIKNSKEAIKPSYNTNKIIVLQNKSFSKPAIKATKQNSVKQNIEPKVEELNTESLFEIY